MTEVSSTEKLFGRVLETNPNTEEIVEINPEDQEDGDDDNNFPSFTRDAGTLKDCWINYKKSAAFRRFIDKVAV